MVQEGGSYCRGQIRAGERGGSWGIPMQTPASAGVREGGEQVSALVDTGWGGWA